MPRVLKRPQAETDLDDIWWYIARDDPDNADQALDRIDERCRVLAKYPLMGVGRDEILPNLRSLAVGKYLIFHLPVTDGLEVVRVLQGMRYIDTLF